MASFCPSAIRRAVSMRLITAAGPTPSNAGRYCGCNAAAGEGDGDAVAGDCAGVCLGVAEGFTCTCTSAAKTLPHASRVVAKAKEIPRMTAYATQCSRFRKVNLALSLEKARPHAGLPKGLSIFCETCRGNFRHPGRAARSAAAFELLAASACEAEPLPAEPHSACRLAREKVPAPPEPRPRLPPRARSEARWACCYRWAERCSGLWLANARSRHRSGCAEDGK